MLIHKHKSHINKNNASYFVTYVSPEQSSPSEFNLFQTLSGGVPRGESNNILSTLITRRSHSAATWWCSFNLMQAGGPHSRLPPPSPTPNDLCSSLLLETRRNEGGFSVRRALLQITLINRRSLPAPSSSASVWNAPLYREPYVSQRYTSPRPPPAAH